MAVTRKRVRYSIKRYRANLRASVRMYERHHGCTTEAKINDVRDGRAEETVGVSRWFFNHRALKRLEEQSGHTNGIATTAT